jgi:hypothetical protein
MVDAKNYYSILSVNMAHRITTILRMNNVESDRRL